MQDLKQQVQLLSGQVQEGNSRLTAQAAQLTGVQGERDETRQQLQALQSTNQVHTATIGD